MFARPADPELQPRCGGRMSTGYSTDDTFAQGVCAQLRRPREELQGKSGVEALALASGQLLYGRTAAGIALSPATWRAVRRAPAEMRLPPQHPLNDSSLPARAAAQALAGLAAWERAWRQLTKDNEALLHEVRGIQPFSTELMLWDDANKRKGPRSKSFHLTCPSACEALAEAGVSAWIYLLATLNMRCHNPSFEEWTLEDAQLVREHYPQLHRSHAYCYFHAAGLQADKLASVVRLEIATLRQRLTDTAGTGLIASEVEQYVTLDKMAALVSRSKRTLEKRKGRRTNPLPNPDVEGGGGRPDEWLWTRVCSWLEQEFGRRLPERLPQWRPPN
jgi:hypothetical protein